MATIHVDVVSAEESIFSGEAEFVVLPGEAGELGIYPRHTPLITRIRPGAVPVAERFELYACGVELANGFGELTDPVQQRARFETEMAKKERVYGKRYPLDEDFMSHSRRKTAIVGHTTYRSEREDMGSPDQKWDKPC